MSRYDALCALLAQPDPADLPPRGRAYTCGGDPMRADAIKLALATAYVWHRLADRGDGGSIVSVRRVRLMRRSA